MAAVSMRELLEAGVHFGHQTRRWDPKMRRFIFGERGGIYIINLEQTQQLLEEAAAYARNLAERGGTVLFVGTKKQAQDSIEEHAKRTGMPYVSHRWLGGLLTNWRTISGRIDRLHELRRLNEEGQLDLLPPKERISMVAELERLENHLGGVADMKRQPDAVLVIDLRKEAIAVREARRLNLPVLALVDTNCDPDEADYVIPGNDDAIKACDLVIRTIANAMEAGKQKVAPEEFQAEAAPEQEPEPPAEEAAAEVAPAEEPAAEEPPAEEPAAEAAPAEEPPAEEASRRSGSSRGATGRAARRGEGGAGRMTEITADLVRQLREMTGAPMMDTKRALQDSNGDIEAARQLLRERGMASASKRAGNNTPEGVVLTRIEDAKGTIVAVGSETEPVSKNDEFRAFANRVLEAVEESGPDAVESLEEERKELIGKIGENIIVRGAARFETGGDESLAAYVHPPANKIGVLVRAEGSPEAVRRLAMHIAFAAPRFATRDEVPEEEVASERSVYEKLPEVESKPEQAREKIVEGMLGKRFFGETVLADQAWIHEPKKTVGQALEEEGVKLLEFERYALAE